EIAQSPWGTGSFPNFTAADLDQDGDLDFVAELLQSNELWYFENRPIGDANNDGVFNSSDLVKIFQAGEYEDEIAENSTFEEGDWNGDGDFDSSDLVAAFQAGTYQANAVARLGGIAAATELIFDMDASKDHRTRVFIP
ncbi:MAG: hypothetical protein KDB27_08050, partial [Planctomycetales bacterium]|nr:hypothetical protein [Planctomycetales bacterium]